MSNPTSVHANGETQGPGVAAIDQYGNMFVEGNLTVGAQQVVGDNGVGVLRLATATKAPTTNPINGSALYGLQGSPWAMDVSGVKLSMLTPPHSGTASFGAAADTMSHNVVTNAVVQPASGELQLMQIWLAAGATISSIGFCTGSTAASGPTHWWACVVDKNYVQQAHSLDQTSTAMGTSTWFKLAMVTPLTATYTGQYFIGIMVATSTTQPSLLGSQVQGAFASGTNAPTPGIGGRSTGSLTVPGTDGTTTYATPTAIGGYYYAYAI